MDNFSEFQLNSDIYKAIALCGYTKPTPVQAKSIPEIMNNRDVVVSAQTGTGKTAAFVLPALNYLSTQVPSRKTRVLILTPTRELASQITKSAGLYGKFMRFNIVSIVGGAPYLPQERDLARGADIIVATPGRLMDHIEKKRVDLSNIDMLILDEADRMLDMGFIDDVQYIAKLTPAKRQTLLFSATLDNKLMNAVKHLLKNPVRIDLSDEILASPQIKQEMYKVSNAHHKNRLLKHFLTDENIYKAIIFSSTKINADRLADQLSDDGFAAAALHGDLRQNVRTRTLDQLRRGKIQYLVATDVAARGIDISDITHVINYDLPRSCEDYVHRIGRTGRAGKAGVAISFVSPTDSRQVKNIERYMGQRIPMMHDIKTSESPRKKHDADEILTLNTDTRFYEDGDDKGRPEKSSRPRRESSFKSDRGSRFERDDRPARGGDKPFRSTRSDSRERGSRFERDDRPARGGDKPFRSTRSDSSERGSRFERDDRPARGGDKPFRSTRSDSSERGSRFERDDKPVRHDRPFKSTRGDKREKPAFNDGFKPKKKYSSANKADRTSEGRGERKSSNGYQRRSMEAKPSRFRSSDK